MKVAFLHPPTSIHYAYQDMLLHPPEGVRFINAKECMTIYKASSTKKKSMMQQLRSLLGNLPIPNLLSVPPKLEKADIIYASQVIPLTKKPYVLDLELPMAITRFKRSPFHNPVHRWILRRKLMSEQCIAVTAWSERARKGLLQIVPEAKHKIHVVMPTITVRQKDVRIGQRTGRHILFVGTDFERKGGLELLIAFKEIRKKVKDARLTMITQLPAERQALADQPGVTILPFASKDDIYTKHYPDADIFILPTLQDTYGLVLIEAMAFRIPCITTDDYATAEIVEHERTGLVLKDSPKFWFTEQGTYARDYDNIYPALERFRKSRPQDRLIRDIVNTTVRLLKDDGLRHRLGAAAQNEVFSGRLSAKHRNRMLSKVLR
jgi:glycosyltransferase involved in cell wall biosynthesis